jgi:hypothetical protein
VNKKCLNKILEISENHEKIVIYSSGKKFLLVSNNTFLLFKLEVFLYKNKVLREVYNTEKYHITKSIYEFSEAHFSSRVLLLQIFKDGNVHFHLF